MAGETEPVVDRIPEFFLPSWPLYLVALHKLAKTGKADIYSQTKRLLQFKLDLHPGLADKWVELHDAATVTLLYNERRPPLEL